ncbi:ATP-binding protein [Streptomyces parvus]|uniref:histidine kinase n=3 Tax=Streptomyces TaxID=1883 RepID=A0A7K3RVQ1_9ACTN|nr:ATP-binding protein [Streptomyces parvus]
MDSEGTEAYLRPRARLMSTLGEELISNERVALTELVKNSYDADASLVLIRFNPPLVEGHGSIEVWDDGHGMSPDTVRGTWMEIATPHRHRNRRSESGVRRVLGAKGIGRFAAARLANVTTITTRRVSDPEVTLRINWGNFTQGDAYLDEVPVTWSTASPSVFAVGGEAARNFADVVTGFQTASIDASVGHGTVVRLEKLRMPWGPDAVEALKRSLSRLLPPPPPAELSVPDQPEFAIYIDTPDGPLRHHHGFVAASETLAHPLYRLVGTVDADGNAHLAIYSSGSEPAVVVEENIRKDSDRPSCGPLKLDFRVWDLEKSALDPLFHIDTGSKNLTEVRKLIRDNSGVALYRDGFRVQPFGEPGYDWLGFDQRRVNNPTMRLSNNQVAGFVYISADENPGLQDRSHREGLIDSPEYEELKMVIVQAISKLEILRYKLRRPESTVEVADEPLVSPPEGRGHGVFRSFNLDPLRQVASERYPDDVVLGRAIEEATETINEGVRKVQEIISQFSRLATLGTLVDVVLHEGRTALARIAFDLRRLRKITGKVEVHDTDLSDALGELHTDFTAQERAIDRLFTRIEPLSGRQRGRPRQLSLHQSISAAVSVLESEIAKYGVTVTIGGEDVTVTAEPGDIRTLVLNLVNNAVYWLSTMPSEADREILIETERNQEGEADVVDITVSDSGPGVRVEIKDLIFDTYFSDKPDGIGLGLSIAGSVVKDFYDGDLSLVSPGALSGASFRARLRRRVG